MYWRNFASALEDISAVIRANVAGSRRNCAAADRDASGMSMMRMVAPTVLG